MVVPLYAFIAPVAATNSYPSPINLYSNSQLVSPVVGSDLLWQEV